MAPLCFLHLIRDNTGDFFLILMWFSSVCLIQALCLLSWLIISNHSQRISSKLQRPLWSFKPVCSLCSLWSLWSSVTLSDLIQPFNFIQASLLENSLNSISLHPLSLLLSQCPSCVFLLPVFRSFIFLWQDHHLAIRHFYQLENWRWVQIIVLWSQSAWTH